MTAVARRKKWLAALLAAGAAVGVLIAAVRRNVRPEFPVSTATSSQGQPIVPPGGRSADGERGWTDPLGAAPIDGSTTTVYPGIHLIGRLGPSAAYAIETSAGIVLVDSGLDGDAGKLKAEMARLNLNWKEIRAILLTHVHGDHCGGAENLRAAAGATVYAGQGDAPILRSGAPREAFFSTYKMPDHAPHPTTVDVELAGDERLDFGDVRIEVLGTPGHTPGSTCYLLERESLRVLFSGDVIQNLGEKPLGTYSAYLAPRYRGETDAYLQTLRKLRNIPVPDLLLPGHPIANRGPTSPRLSSDEWHEMLDRGIQEMQELQSRYALDGANFLDGHPKRLLVDLYYLGDFDGAAVYGFFKDSKFFLVDAPGGADLPDFLESSFRQLGLTPAEPTAVLLTACGDKETGGLRTIIERSHAQVVAAAEGLKRIRPLLPPGTIVCDASDLPKRGWFDATVVELTGRGVAPVAYLVRWAGKPVLFSGRIIAPLDPELFAELSQALGDPRGYTTSLRKLAELRPSVWLPAIPANGQNANVYNNSWSDLIENNYRAASEIARGR